MRHRKKRNKLSRDAAHRAALLSNLSKQLIEHERIQTSQAKAKAVDAALRTPPGTEDVGLDTDKAGMKSGMPVPENIADLAAIPAATLKRMRGDLL